MEPTTGLEPVTSSLPRKCSNQTELRGQKGNNSANKINYTYKNSISKKFFIATKKPGLFINL